MDVLTPPAQRSSEARSGFPEPGVAGVRVGLVSSCVWPIPGGMEVYLRELAQALAADGHHVRVAARFAEARPDGMGGLHRGSEPGRRYREGDVEVEVVGAGRRAGWLRPVHRLHFHAPALAVALVRGALGRGLSQALAGADVVHYSGTGRELLGFAAERIARRMGVPFVVTPHTHAGVWGDSALDLSLYRRAARVVALTDDERARLVARGVSEERVPVVGHGVSVRGGGDGARFRARHRISGPVVLFLGRKEAYKGYPLLLEAAPALWSRVPDARFVLAGPAGDPLPEALEAIRADPRVLDAGFLSEAEREDALAACDVLAAPSEAEAFGLVVDEAWAYGRPVVVRDIPTMRERVGGGGGGLLVPRSPTALADALAHVLTDEPMRSAMGERGRRDAEGRTWEAVARTMGQVYRSAIGGASYAPGGSRHD